MLEFKGKLPPEQGAVFLKAMDAVLQALRKDHEKVANPASPMPTTFSTGVMVAKPGWII